MHYLRDRTIDLAASAMVGDRETDMLFATHLGVRGFKLSPKDDSWAAIAHALVDAPRTARIERATKETRVRVSIDLDRLADPVAKTGLGFFDHMLEQLARTAASSSSSTAQGDLHMEAHHTVEDTALALGDALKQALGDKVGISRYGFHPADGRGPGRSLGGPLGPADVVFKGTFPRPDVDGFPTEMVEHFFRSLADGLAPRAHRRRGARTLIT